MKTLTPPEYRELQDLAGDDCILLCCETVAEERTLEELTAAGLARYAPDAEADDGMSWVITDRGLVALRAHQAWLQSIGGS